MLRLIGTTEGHFFENKTHIMTYIIQFKKFTFKFIELQDPSCRMLLHFWSYALRNIFITLKYYGYTMYFVA